MGSAAHLVALRREAIGKYNVKDAWTVQQLTEQVQQLKQAATHHTAEAERVNTVREVTNS